MATLVFPAPVGAHTSRFSLVYRAASATRDCKEGGEGGKESERKPEGQEYGIREPNRRRGRWEVCGAEGSKELLA